MRAWVQRRCKGKAYLPVRDELAIRKANHLSLLLALHLACGVGQNYSSGYVYGIISGGLS